jgi:uncharacterized surface protein with fasciclin (FAS1) repeats
MKRNSLFNKIILGAVLPGLLMLALVVGCNDPELELSTTEDVVITDYFRKNENEFSEFLKVLELSSNAGFLGAYGTYTCFAPTNEAIARYLAKKNISSVEDIEVEELKTLVRFHVIKDTLSTTSFTDGKLQRPTMHGQYLITGVANVGGQSSVRVNRQANIVQSNIRTANGLIHVIDEVMEPAALTIAKMLEADPNYSIFLQAVNETGFYNKLNTVEINNDGTTSWLTVVAQSNATFASSGFDDYEEVKERYSHTGNPQNPADSLYLFVAYRILPGIKYVADLVTAPSHATLAPSEVITIRLEGQQVKINADVFRGVQEPGAVLNRDVSDYSATNGVLHISNDNYSIKVRVPYSYLD